jgi:hypothetical protein
MKRRQKMFWKRKEATKEAGVNAEELTPLEMPEIVIKEPETQKAGKLPGPRSIEELVGRELITTLHSDPDWMWQLRSVIRQRADGPHRFDFRVFDEAQLAAKKVKIKDYNSFDHYPELVLYQGWFDKVSMEVHFNDEKKVTTPSSITPPSAEQILTEKEIWQRIAELSEPGSTIFFYLTGSPASGGPLGRGAAIVELNPNYPGKKQKRYNLYPSNVDGLEPGAKMHKWFESDSSKEIAKFVKERHYKPTG